MDAPAAPPAVGPFTESSADPPLPPTEPQSPPFPPTALYRVPKPEL